MTVQVCASYILSKESVRISSLQVGEFPRMLPPADGIVQSLYRLFSQGAPRLGGSGGMPPPLPEINPETEHCW